MNILDNLKDKVKGATFTAVKASSEFIEVTKINLSIKSEEEKAKEAMFEIGKLVYEGYKEGKAVEAELSIKCDAIGEAEKKIEELKAKIMEIKNLKKCTGCDTEVDGESAYCPKCGTKMN